MTLTRSRLRVGYWLCRLGLHDWGWTGVDSQSSGQQYRCERRYCPAERWDVSVRHTDIDIVRDREVEDYTMARELIRVAEVKGAFVDEIDEHALRDAVKRLHGRYQEVVEDNKRLQAALYVEMAQRKLAEGQ